MVAPVVDLHDELRQLRQAQLISGVGSWQCEVGGLRMVASDVMLDLYGLDCQALPDHHSALVACVHAEDRDRLAEAMDHLAATGEAMNVRYRVIRPCDGRERWFDARGIVERDDAIAGIRLAGTVADVTELVLAEFHARRAHDELVQAHAHQQAVITATPDVIHVYDVDSGTLSRANRIETPLIGFTPELVRVMSGRLDDLVTADDARKLQDTYLDAERLSDGAVVQLVHPVVHASGETRWLSRRMTPFARDEDGAVTRILVVSRDMTDVVTLEQSLEHAALHDDMTGLPNRRLIRDRIEHALQRTARGGRVAVLICDLDGFKRINDSHGHHTGDVILMQVAARMRDVLRAGDTIGRMGGDEFAVVLDIPETSDPVELAEEVATRLAAVIGQPIAVGGRTHSISVSIGICIAEDDTTADDLLSDADAAMYYVKHHGCNGHAFFHPDHRPDMARRDHIERQLRQALRRTASRSTINPSSIPTRTGSMESRPSCGYLTPTAHSSTPHSLSTWPNAPA